MPTILYLSEVHSSLKLLRTGIGCLKGSIDPVRLRLMVLSSNVIVGCG